SSDWLAYGLHIVLLVRLQLAFRYYLVFAPLALLAPPIGCAHSKIGEAQAQARRVESEAEILRGLPGHISIEVEWLDPRAFEARRQATTSLASPPESSARAALA